MIKTLFPAGVLFWAVAGSTAALAGTIEGSVRDMSGRPLISATVYAQNTVRAPGPRRRAMATTDSEGRFILRDIAPGTYEVHAYKGGDGYMDTFFAFYGINEKAWRVVEVDESSISGVVLELGPQGARLELSIKNGEGKPLGGSVTLRRVDAPDLPVSIGINAESSNLVPPVPFRFEVAAEGYQIWQSSVLRPKPGERFRVSVQLRRSTQPRH
jgi:hypothetical protein